MKKWYNISWNRVVELLETNENRGLAQDEIIERREKYGSNQINIDYNKEIGKGALEIFTSRWFIILFTIIIFLIVSKNYLPAVIVFFALTSNIGLKYVDSSKRRNQMKNLELLNYTDIHVIRDGRKQVLNAEELVVGDIVYIKNKTYIPADLRIIESDGLKINEKNITGDGFSVDKYETMVEGIVSSIGEVKNMAFRGSLVTAGEGLGVIVATGHDTEIGKILTLLSDNNKHKHIIGKKLEAFINKSLVVLAVVGCVLSIIMFELYRFDNLLESISNIWFILGSFQLSIVLVAYIKLIKKYLSNEGIELENISTLDTITNTNVFFLDKIGSVTAKQMMVKKLYTNHEHIKAISVDTSNFNISRMINIGLLCNNAIYNNDKNFGTGDLAEIAMLRFGGENGIYKGVLLSKERRIFEIPYDSDRRMMTSLNKVERKYRANIKGTLDEVLDRCTHIMLEGIEKDITEEDIEKIKEADYNLSLEGLITIGIAYRSFTYEPSEDENIESNLVFVGIMGLENPIIEDSFEYIKSLKEQNIVPILITDDNKIAATTLGKELGFVSSMDEVISGVELLALNKEEVLALLSKVRVFSRISPELKVKIIAIFSDDKYNIAATGENLADLPTIALSEVGIVKGEKVTSVVKGMSDLYASQDYLKGFLDVLDLSRKIKISLSMVKRRLIQILATEAAVFTTTSLIWGVGNLSWIYIAIMNVLIIPSLMLYSLLTDRKVNDKNKKRLIVESIIQIGLILLILCIIDFRFNLKINWSILFTPLIFINTLNNNYGSLKEEGKQSIIILSSVIAIYILNIIVTFITQNISNMVILIYVFTFIVIYGGIELFLNKRE
ncbi:ATPase, P-type (transporting), HAD superfamily, subfamily IC [Clostridium cavendishii DSM 21758]|uniref:ATPase, P-type (Transporting), HAD superfamily, subfamily IC n=1 Tax=Clostridium cavendishii DSM 21758 TaxID=1121302 RepID=A0A1M6AQ26_9CLOT|nr:cation-transporting P-type ATPase [Clostridium cavendishii]SHI38507.1 ATPase, P-type (transporting), HAD superfamily, subfamily IC [Clostridium cavendishii DSM 21758]